MNEHEDNIISIINRIKPETKKYSKEKLRSYPLTNPEIGFNSVEMIYLLLEICRLYCISPNSDLVSGYSFNYIDNIAKKIESYRVN